MSSLELAPRILLPEARETRLSPQELQAKARKLATTALKGTFGRLEARKAAKELHYQESLQHLQSAQEHAGAVIDPLIHYVLGSRAQRSPDKQIRASFADQAGNQVIIENVKGKGFISKKTGKAVERPPELDWWRTVIKRGGKETVVLFKPHPEFTHKLPDFATEVDGKRQELYALDTDTSATLISELAGGLELFTEGLRRRHSAEAGVSLSIEDVVPERAGAQVHTLPSRRVTQHDRELLAA